jgi:hypothetical protein
MTSRELRKEFLEFFETKGHFAFAERFERFAHYSWNAAI